MTTDRVGRVEGGERERKRGGGRGDAASSDGDDRSERSRRRRASPGHLGGVAADGEEGRRVCLKKKKKIIQIYIYNLLIEVRFSLLFAAGSEKKKPFDISLPATPPGRCAGTSQGLIIGTCFKRKIQRSFFGFVISGVQYATFYTFYIFRMRSYFSCKSCR